ncbi:MAG: type 2 lantipeptide synthetase LanM [Deltaproteobacteria bacterium]|nr:type 2 lantipeptide synthetase LanM [Deltaproteobacteria bacterium]
MVLERKGRWIASVSRGDERRFREILIARGLDPDRVHDYLRDVRIVDPKRLPSWAEGFVELLSQADFLALGEQPVLPPVDVRLPPLYPVFTRFADAAARMLDPLLLSCGVSFATEARQDVVHFLVTRWIAACESGLWFEGRMQRELGRGDEAPLVASPNDHFRIHLDTVDDWTNFCERYPVLLRVIGTLYVKWKEVLAEMFARLTSDLPSLRKWDDQPLEKVSRCRLGAGDSHAGGRTVAILTFENGHRLVYKPRDVRPEALLNRYLEVTNPWTSEPPLSTYRVLVRDGYGWVEYVEPNATLTQSSASSFYKRVGRLVRLLQLLGAHDLHWENVVISQENLVVLDVEAMLATPVVDRRPAPQTNAMERLRNSPLSVGILPPSWAVGPYGRRPAELSPLSGGGMFPSVGRELIMELGKTGMPRAVGSYRTYHFEPRQPQADGRFHSAAEYAADIVAGYRAMNQLIVEHHPELRCAFNVADMAVRFVPRNTAFYARFLNESLLPRCLQSGADRDIQLQQLFRACHEGADEPARLIESEVRSLWELDIPYFMTTVDRDSVLLDDGTELGHYFDETGLSALERRWAGFDPPQLAEQIDMIQSGLYTSQPSEGTRGDSQRLEPRGRGVPLSRSLGADRIACAQAVGDLILSERFTDGNRPSFLGIHYLPVYDVSELSVLRSDLLSGVGGLAVVLAELFEHTGERRFGESADQLAQGLRLDFEGQLRALEEYRHRGPDPSGKKFFAGGMMGLGSLIYGLKRAGRTDDIEEVMSRWCSEDDDHLALLISVSPHDVVSGVAGLLLALLSRPATLGCLALAKRLGDWLGKEPLLAGGETLYPPEAPLLRCVPDSATGVAFALFKLGSLTDPALYRSADLRAALTEARPTPGNLLARLCAMSWSEDRTVVDETARALAGLDQAASTLELLDGFELAFVAWHASGDSAFHDSAANVAGELVARYLERGTWFAQDEGADRHRLSAITGVAAIAHALLRLEFPRHSLCLRLLE